MGPAPAEAVGTAARVRSGTIGLLATMVLCNRGGHDVRARPAALPQLGAGEGDRRVVSEYQTDKHTGGWGPEPWLRSIREAGSS